MPTETILPSANGFYNGWTSIVGASQGWDAVNEDDGDGSCIIIANPGFDPAAPSGTASFIFSGPSNLRPTQVRIVTTHKRHAGFAPVLIVGILSLHRWGGKDDAPVFAFHPSGFTSTGSYQTHSRAFDTNPLNAEPWQPGDLTGVEFMVGNISIFGSRVTKMAVEIDYDEPTMNQYRGMGAIVG